MTVDDILRHRLQVELAHLGGVNIAPTAKRPRTPRHAQVPSVLWFALVDPCVDWIAPQRRAAWLVDAADRRQVPDDGLDGNDQDAITVHRLLAEYHAAAVRWRSDANGVPVIASLRTWTIDRVAEYSPRSDRSDVLHLIKRIILKHYGRATGRTRAVLLAEAIGVMLGYERDVSRDPRSVRDRDRRRAQRYSDVIAVA